MHVLRHHHVAENPKRVPAPYFLESSFEDSWSGLRRQKGFAIEAAEGDEMQVAILLVPLQTVRHVPNVGGNSNFSSDDNHAHPGSWTIPPTLSPRAGEE